MGMRMRFVIDDESPIMDMDVRDIGLKPREKNCLLRSGMMTVRDVVESVGREDDLMNLRNCGQTMAHNIMVALFRLCANEAKEKQEDSFYQKCRFVYPETEM